MRTIVFLFVLVLVLPVQASSWTEPRRGSQTRAALMDAIRPHVEWILGGPIEFVVYDLRVDGPLGFANVYPQRPGGAPIDLSRSPAFVRGEMQLEPMDEIGIQALFIRSGQTWVAVHWVLGATDVWYAWEPICQVWRPVIPEACQGL